MINEWLSNLDLSVYGFKYVLLRELYFDYRCYCKENGISDICTDRFMSKQLQAMGFAMKKTNKGLKFLMTKEEDTVADVDETIDGKES